MSLWYELLLFCDIKSDVKIEIDSRTITKFIMWNSVC